MISRFLKALDKEIPLDHILFFFLVKIIFCFEIFFIVVEW